MLDVALKLLKEITSHSYKAYIVGGFVRDYLLGIEAADFDITTNAKPDELLNIFSGYRVIETGLKHGTVTVVTEYGNVEITTYRADGNYLDSRHPDSVKYLPSLEEDVKRRDFTMNAIAYNRKEGIVDYCGGCADICRESIKTVGDGDRRFKEDALRIMRCIRFAATTGFEIEDSTREAAIGNKELLKNISKERIREELNRLILGDYAKDVIYEYAEILGVLYPDILKMKGFEQKNKFHKYDVLEHCLFSMEYVPKKVHLKLAALLHDIGKPHTLTIDDEGIAHFYSHAQKSVEIAENILRDLKYDNATIDKVLLLVKYHDTPIEGKKMVKRWLGKYGEEFMRDLIWIKRADNFAQSDEVAYRMKDIDGLEETLDAVLAENSCFSLKDLAVDGNDLIAIGIEGTDIGRILNGLLELVIDEKVDNDKGKLLEQVANLR